MKESYDVEKLYENYMRLSMNEEALAAGDMSSFVHNSEPFASRENEAAGKAGRVSVLSKKKPTGVVE